MKFLSFSVAHLVGKIGENGMNLPYGAMNHGVSMIWTPATPVQ